MSEIIEESDLTSSASVSDNEEADLLDFVHHLDFFDKYNQDVELLPQREKKKDGTALQTCVDVSNKQHYTPPKQRRKPSWMIRNGSNAMTGTKPSNILTFISSPKASSSSFRSRLEGAKESLKARSQTAVLEQSENERAERTRQALETMQSWRTNREKSKAQRHALFEEEARLRRQRRKERRMRETQMRDSMNAAAEEAKLNALESGCTEEEAVVEAAAAASRVANADDDDNSTSLIDSDEDSYLDDDDECEGEDVMPDVLFDDAASTCKNDEEQRSPTTNTDFSVEESESTHSDDVGCCSNQKKEEDKEVSCKEDISTTPIETETKLSSDEADISPKASVPHIHHDVIDSLEDSTSVSSQHTLEEAEQQTMCGVDEIEIDSSPISSPYNELDASITESMTTTFSTPETEQHNSITTVTIRLSPRISDDKPPPPPTQHKKGRQLCVLFPSFSSIFTKFAKKGKACVMDDSAQKELLSCMHHQIKIHEMNSCNNNVHAKDDSSLESNPESRRFYRINSRRPEVRALLDDVFSHHALTDWNEVPPDGDNWNLLWTWGLPKASDFDNLLVFQKVNRFRHTKGLTNKALLKKNMHRFSSGHLMPLTYALPHEYNAFVSGYSSIQKSAGNTTSPNYWIVKPIGLSRGRGISIIKDISQVSYSQPIVIQRYVSNPMLFMGYKFDLRIYVLVTSFNPLEAFIYKEGLARFGSRKYSNNPESLGDTRVHLTNTSLQKEFGDIPDRSHPAYLAGSNGSGSKVALSWLWNRLKCDGVNTADLWMKIIDICRKALCSVESDIPNQPNSFELFGFDVIFDTDQKCWLIEVNSSPSLTCDSSLDNRIKGGLIVDTVSLVDPVAYDRIALVKVLNRRIAHRKAGSLLEEDLSRILPDTIPRRVGDIPKRVGGFERI